ncbi:hypothetical protein KEM52_000254 [Ascosphaera acerosa]|nr:hypothetical protein KEM52_000254 [Ascosphaera acerosa]
MIERALSRAHAAVILDQREHFENALEAYRDTCHLLEEAMQAADLDEERRKLGDIYESYLSRISELEGGEHQHDSTMYGDKLLPALPTTPDLLTEILSECSSDDFGMPGDTMSDSPVLEDSAQVVAEAEQRTDQARQQQQLLLRKPRTASYSHLPPRWSKSQGSSIARDPPIEKRLPVATGGLPRPAAFDSPVASSPRDPSPYVNANGDDRHSWGSSRSRSSHNSQQPLTPTSLKSSHRRGHSSESAAWLGTINEAPSAPQQQQQRFSGGFSQDPYSAPFSHDSFSDAVDDAVDAVYDEYYEDFFDDDDDSEDQYEDYGIASAAPSPPYAQRSRIDSLAGDNTTVWSRRSSAAVSNSAPSWTQSSATTPQSQLDISMDQSDWMRHWRGTSKTSFDAGKRSSAYSIGYREYSERSRSRGFSNAGKTDSTVMSPCSMAALLGGPGKPPDAPLPPLPDAKPIAARPLRHSSHYSFTPTSPSHGMPSATLAASKPGDATAQPRSSVLSRRSRVLSKRLSINVSNLTNGHERGVGGSLGSRQGSEEAQRTASTDHAAQGNASDDPALRSDEAPTAPIRQTGRQRQPRPPRNSSLWPPTRGTGDIPDPHRTTSKPFLTGNASSPTLGNTAAFAGDGEGGYFQAPNTRSRPQTPISPTTPSTPYLRQAHSPLTEGMTSYLANDNTSNKFGETGQLYDFLDFSQMTPLTGEHLLRHQTANSIAEPSIMPSTPARVSAPLTATSHRPSLASATLPGTSSIYETALQDPVTYGAWDSDTIDAPYPLESCPQSGLLRPYWLLRCLYQSIAHPRGGYVTTKLFIPKTVWQVHNVRLRAVADKINYCNQLTTALQKLADVDMNDVEAVNGEMQSLEGLLDQMQSSLARKLGSEVGPHGAAMLFKTQGADGDDGPSGHSQAGATGSETPVVSNSVGGGSGAEVVNEKVGGAKSYLTPWRKLRSKGMAGLDLATLKIGDASHDGLNMPTLPIMDSMSYRGAKRYPAQIQYSGPNASYMSAVARLSDAAQILDQVARQFGDPGIRSSSPTHVGLVLGLNRASDFFAYYICRFILNDLGLMMDKYLKRAAEWIAH